MKKIKFISTLFLTLNLFLTPLHLKAQETTGVEKMPSVQEFILAMNKKHGFSIEELNSVFSKVKLREIVVQQAAAPAEAMTWARYQKIFLTENRIQKGAQYMIDNYDILMRAQNEFGVPKEIITAILGVETNYGENKGNHLVIDALASLAFQPNRRQKFFTSELEHLLLMSKEENIRIEDLKGSYAGAMGIAQFIPSSYRRLSIDYDGDNSRDLINSKTDAIGSVAHYLAEHAWQRGGPIAEQLPPRINQELVSPTALKPSKPLKDWIQSGVQVEHPNKTINGRILSFDGVEGDEYWMTYQNFYAITRYNQSKLYAMAVFQLSEKIRFEFQRLLAGDSVQTVYNTTK